MGKYDELQPADFRAAYWLLGECSELGRSAEAWTQRLFAFFQRHLGVHMAAFFEGSADMAHGNSSPGPKDPVLIYGKPPQQVTRLMQDYWRNGGINDDPAMPVWRQIKAPLATRARQHLAPDKAWDRSVIVNDYFRRTDSNEMLLSCCPVIANTHLLINLWRMVREQPFSDRDTQLVALITEEISPLLRTGRLAPLSAGVTVLSPRLRQVADMLCSGMTEREVAAALGTSVHTVHNQARTIYRTLRISSRNQLIALTYQSSRTPKA